MGKSQGNGESFSVDLVHALIERAIEELKKGGITIGPKTHDILYRMGVIGTMAALTAMDATVPRAVTAAIRRGQALSKKRWQEILK